MEFWLFMLFNVLLIPAIMWLFGGCFQKHPPKEIQGFFGYRTRFSRKNQDTWKFAHAYCGRLWRKTGGLLLPASLAAMFWVYGKPEETVGMAAGSICVMQCVVLLLSIAATEKALRRNFDEQGNRKL